MKNVRSFRLWPTAAFLLACASPTATREPASLKAPAGRPRGNAFDHVLRDLGLNVYFANLHAHHFMGKGQPSDYTCKSASGYAYDDGRPCRNNDERQNTKIEHADFLDYFTEACDYAREKGGLDILMITAHTKTSREKDTDTPPAELDLRRRKLAEINAKHAGRFLCGLGQEASSISAGNHLGVMGHFPAQGEATNPIYFDTGRFDRAYREMGERSRAGERFIVQFNHPDVPKDLWWKPLAQTPRKEAMNDYGLDDFAPIGCALKPAQLAESGEVCTAERREFLDRPLLEQTFARIREVANDPFRLIEVVRTGGATANPGEDFVAVHQRGGAPEAEHDHGDEESGPAEKDSGFASLDKEIYNYIFYLNMGFRLGPTGNQDNHHMNWGTASATRTGVVAASLAENDVFRALDSRRTYGSEDRNARALIYARLPEQIGKKERVIMGDVAETQADHVRLYVLYDDPDAQDLVAGLRLYYYRAGQKDLDFSRRVAPSSVQRLIEFGPNGQVTLPSGPPSDPAFKLATSDRDPTLRAGYLAYFTLPLEAGEQYVFAEITQKSDRDRIWTAPIWIKRVPKP